MSDYPPPDIAPSAQRISEWERLCLWLEAQPYNASYQTICGYLLVTAEGYTIKEYGKEAYDYAHLIDRERKALDLVFWSSGHGWRLRKDYAKKLVILKEKFLDKE